MAVPHQDQQPQPPCTPSGPVRLLLVEDDAKLAALVTDYLTPHGFAVSVHPTGRGAVDRIVDEQPDAVVLDIMLPEVDGFTICREARTRYTNPILMLTARGAEDDELTGLQAGADDYLPKPVRPRVLLARIQAQLRWLDRSGPASEWIDLGHLVVDAGRRAVRLGEAWVDLTTAEFDLLWILASRAGQLVTRSEICQELRGFEYNGLDRTIDLRVARLRKKLGDEGRNPRLIKSIRGEGYQLVRET